MLLSAGAIPVLGNLGTRVGAGVETGEATTTVASEKSIAVRPLACPSAVPVFVTVWVIFVWQVKVHVSLLSSKLLLFKSPG